jgi:hypothetical protein
MGAAPQYRTVFMAEPLTPEEVGHLVRVIEDQKAEIVRLRSEQSLYDVLREIAIDPEVPPHVRLKAAEAGVAYERPKLSASVSMVGGLGIGARLEAFNQANRARDRARERGMRVIEGASDAPD